MPQGGFLNAVARGTDETELLGYSFARVIGDLTGLDVLSKWGKDGVQRNLKEIAANPPKIESWDDVNGLSDFADYVIEGLGEQAPALLSVLIPGIGAGAIAETALGKAALSTAAKATIGKAIKRKIGYQAFDEFAKRKGEQVLSQVAANPGRVGGVLGTYAAATALNAGQTGEAQAERGISEPGEALAAGAIKGVLDVLTVDKITGAAKALGVPPAHLLDVAQRASRVALGTGAVAAAATGTKAAIDMLALNAEDPTYNLFTDDNLKALREAVIQGGIGGAVLGGAVHSAVEMKNYRGHREAVAKDIADVGATFHDVMSAPKDEIPDHTDIPDAPTPKEIEANLTPKGENPFMPKSVGDELGADYFRAAAEQYDHPETKQALLDRASLIDQGGAKPVANEDFFSLHGIEPEPRPPVAEEAAQAQAADQPELAPQPEAPPAEAQARVVPDELAGQFVALSTGRPEDIGPVSSLLQALPIAHQNSLADLMKGGANRKNSARMLVDIARDPQRAERLVKDANAQEAAAQIRDEESPHVSPEYDPGLEATQVTHVVEPVNNKGGRGFDTEAEAQAAIAAIEKKYPNPNVAEHSVVGNEKGKFFVRTTMSPENLAPEANVRSNESGRSVNKSTIRTAALPARSETAFTNDMLANARDRGGALAQRAKVRGEGMSPELRQRLRRSVIVVGTPEGKTTSLHAGQLAFSGRQINNSLGAEASTVPHSLVRGLETSLAALHDRGYDVSDAFRDGKIRDDLILQAKELNESDAANDRTVAQLRAAHAKEMQRNTNLRATGQEDARDIVGTQGEGIEHLTPEKPAVPADTINRGETLPKRAVNEDAAVPSPEQAAGEKEVAALQERRAEKRRTLSKRLKLSERGNVSGIGENITRRDVDFVDGVLHELGLKDARVNLISEAELGSEQAKQLIPKEHLEAAIEDFKNRPELKGRAYWNGTIILRDLALDTPEAPAHRLLMLGHEVGHVALWRMHEQLSPENRARLDKAWKADRERSDSPASWNGEGGHEEWFADKVSAWAAHLQMQPKNAVDRIFKQTALALQKIWNAIKGKVPKRFHENKTFNDVMAQMKQQDITDAELQPVPGPARDMIWNPNTNARQATKDQLQKATKFMRSMMTGAVDRPKIGKLLFTKDTRLRAISPELAERVYHQSNTERKGLSFHSSVDASRALWKSTLEKRLSKWITSKPLMEEAFDQLAQELPTGKLNEPAKIIRSYLNDYYSDYLLPRLPDLKRVPDYFPRNWSKLDVAQRSVEFKQILMKHGFSQKAADELIVSFLADKPTSTTMEVLESWQRERQIKNPALIKELAEKEFLTRDPHQALNNYIDRTTHRAQLSEIFGKYITVQNKSGKGFHQEWRIAAKAGEIISKLPKEKQGEAAALFESSIFPKQGDPNSKFQAVLNELKAYEGARLLLGSGLSSIPEIGAVFMRTKGEMGLNEFMKAFGSTVKNWDDAHDAASAIGSLQTTLTPAALAQMFGEGSDFGKRGFFRKHLPKMFKWNGNDFIVDFSRTLGSGIARKFLVQQAEKIATGKGNVAQAERFLKELGVTSDQVARWDKAGQPLWDEVVNDPHLKADVKAVQDAINNFVNESTLRPNASERPTWADHPLGALAFHLKTFAYSFNKVILSGAFRELENRLNAPGGGELTGYVPFLLAAFGMLTVLGAASDEIRQRIFSFGSKGTLDKTHYDPGKTAVNWLNRAGILQLPFENVVMHPLKAESYAYDAGPFAHHLYSLMFDNYGDKTSGYEIAKSLPIINQLPGVRGALARDLG